MRSRWVCTAAAAAAVAALAACATPATPADEDASTTSAPTTSAPAASTADDAVVAESLGPTLDAFAVPGDHAPSHVLDRAAESSGRIVVLVREGPTEEGWLRVDLPVRPNGTSGWIRAADVSLAATPYRIEVDLSDRRLVVLDGGDVVVDVDVGLGAGAPALPGEFFVREVLAPTDAFGDYGQYALGLSGFALVQTSTLGGDGRLTIHGTNRPAQLGVDGGPGTLRVTNDVMTRLVEQLQVPLGTPVTIEP